MQAISMHWTGQHPVNGTVSAVSKAATTSFVLVIDRHVTPRKWTLTAFWLDLC